jgi:hypothetical protein
MKIKKLDILAICNISHPDFGTFAKFLDGLGKDAEIDIPAATEVFICDVCHRPLWLKDVPCLYCKGLKDGQTANPFKDHVHTWTADEPIHCIKCNVLKKFLI